MIADANYPFDKKKDVGGGNIWIWAKTRAVDGFEIIKVGEPLADVPDLAPVGDKLDIDGEAEPLNEDHDKLILWLTKAGLPSGTF